MREQRRRRRAQLAPVAVSLTELASIPAAAELKAALVSLAETMALGFREPAWQGNADPSVAASTPSEIGLPELRRRSRDYLMGHYLGLHITVVSVALALSGGAAASLIARQSISAEDLGLLWLLWLGSVLATAMA